MPEMIIIPRPTGDRVMQWTGSNISEFENWVAQWGASVIEESDGSLTYDNGGTSFSIAESEWIGWGSSTSAIPNETIQQHYQILSGSAPHAYSITGS